MATKGQGRYAYEKGKSPFGRKYDPKDLASLTKADYDLYCTGKNPPKGMANKCREYEKGQTDGE